MIIDLLEDFQHILIFGFFMPKVLLLNIYWMVWNLFLAFLPFALSFFIFKKALWNRKSIIFKILLTIAFIIFYFLLPNAPYVLTDIIHMVRQIKDYKYFGLSDNDIIVLIIPQYLFFIFIGFSFYVLSFQNFLHFLIECNFKVFFIWLIKIINPFLMAIGIFLGRVYRFNSWDIIAKSDNIIKSTLEGFTNFYFFVFIVFLTIIIFIGFEILSIFYKSLFKNLFDLNPKK